jgi:hypothetical protein
MSSSLYIKPLLEPRVVRSPGGDVHGDESDD